MRSIGLGLAITAGFALGCSSEALSDSNPASPPAAGGQAGASSTAGGTSSVDAAPSPYPSGPYGRGEGAVIENLSFLGWRDPAGANYDVNRLEVVRLSDFYNPDGSADGVRLLVLNASAVWCSVCRVEYQHLNTRGTYAQYRPKGVEILGVIFEDNEYAPAKPSDLRFWGGPEGFEVTFPLVLDPGFKTGIYFSSDATPLNLLIDATTMRIVDVLMGYDASNPDTYWRRIDELLGP